MAFVIAIDGPAGVGKGTLADFLAKRFDLINIDTGATYRCVTLAMLKKGVKLEELDKIQEILENISIEFKDSEVEQQVFLNGEDVTKQIRSAEVNSFVAQISSIREVRLKMVELQRKLAEGKNVIMDGRDIGTYVFPNAEVKLFVDASAEERAKRRYEQNKEKGIDIPYEEVLDNIKARDEKDRNKELGALKPAQDSIIIDTTEYTLEENQRKVEKIVTEKLQQLGKI